MPLRDSKLTLSGISTSGTAGAQPIISTASCWANSPFDTGAQYSGQYGQSPYQSTNKMAVAATIGQAPKKFFFLVNAINFASGGTAATGVTIALTNCATAAGTSSTNLVALQTAKILYPTLTAAANPGLLCKFALPEPLLRYINGRFTVGTGVVKKLTVMAELTEY